MTVAAYMLITLVVASPFLILNARSPSAAKYLASALFIFGFVVVVFVFGIIGRVTIGQSRLTGEALNVYAAGVSDFGRRADLAEWLCLAIMFALLLLALGVGRKR